MRHVKHIHSPRISVLTWHLEPLHDLFRALPKSEQIFWRSIRTANLERGIKDTEFQFKKRRILIVYHLLEKLKGLNRDQIQTLADTILNRRDLPAVRVQVLELLKVAEKDEGSTSGRFIAPTNNYITWTPPISNISKSMTKEALWRGAGNFVLSVPDSRFLSSFKKTEPIDECLRDAVNAAEEIAYVYLRKLSESLVDKLGKEIFTIQKGERDKQIQREIPFITSDEDKELGILRSEFVHQVEVLSRERSRS